MATTTQHAAGAPHGTTEPRLQGSVVALVPAPPDRVFDVLTDVRRLPVWNAVITGVPEIPERVDPGAEWVVELAALGRSWRSRSRVTIVDAGERRFVYRSWTDDGNPSYGEWMWSVDALAEGSQVHIAWALHPQTFWRQRLLGPMRNRMLRREVAASVDALVGMLVRDTTAVVR